MAIIRLAKRAAKRALQEIGELPTKGYRMMIKVMRWHVGRRGRRMRVHVGRRGRFRRRPQQRNQVPDQIPEAAVGEADVPAENMVEEEPVMEMVMPEAPLYNRVLILGPGGLSVDFPGELANLAEELTPVIRSAMIAVHNNLPQQ